MLTRPAFGHDDSQVPWPSTLPGTSSCPCLAGVVSRACRFFFIWHFFWAFVAARYRCAHEHTPGDTWRSSPRLTVRSHIINIDETCCKMLPPLERARWTHNPMVQPHARAYRARQQGRAGKNLQGRAREGVARSQRPARRHSQHRPEHPKASAAFSRDGPTTRCRRSRRCITTQQLGPTSSAPMPSGQTSSLLPHRATSQARSSSITASVWRWSSADANSASDRLKQTEDEELLIHTFPSVDPRTVSTRDAALDLNCPDGSTQGGSMATGFTASELKQRG